MHEVWVAASDAPYMDSWSTEWEASGATVLRFPYIHSYRRISRCLGAVLDLRQRRRVTHLTKTVKPDLIHINQQNCTDALDLVMACDSWLTGVPLLGTIHIPLSSTSLKESLAGLRDSLARRVYKHKNYHKIFVAEWARGAFFTAHPFHSDNSSVVYNCTSAPEISSEPPQSLRRRLGLHESRPIIVFAARFTEQKNPMLLISAAADLPKDLEFQLVFLGTGELESQIRKHVSEFGLADRTVFPGYVKNIDDYMSACDVFVNTSRFEGFSFGILEAMSHKKAIVCTNIQANSEAIGSSECAILFRTEDKEDLCAALSRVLKEKQLRETLGRRSHKRWTEHFTLESFGSRMLELYGCYWK
jgi:glycosyltransferase involved in cell wall biosynthesis